VKSPKGRRWSWNVWMFPCQWNWRKWRQNSKRKEDQSQKP